MGSSNKGGIAGNNSGTLKVESVYYKNNISNAVGSGSCNGTASSMSDANMIAAVGNTDSLSYKLNDYIKKHPSLTILPAMPPVSVGDCVTRKLWEVSNTNNGGYPTISNGDSSEVKCYWTDEGIRDTSWYEENKSATVYTLSTPEQLGGLAYLVNNGIDFSGKTIKLGADIDLSGTTHTNGGDGFVWEPIGKSTDYGSDRYLVRSAINYAFAGTFDGQGNTISNMTVRTNISSAGLFGYVNGGTIKNVILDSTCSVTSNYVYYVGGIVGRAYNATIKDVTNNATVQGRYCFVGGIVGYAYGNSSLIQNATNSGNVSGKSFVGGIVGYSSTTVKYATNGGNVSGTSYVGGIIGYSSATVKDTTNGGNVSGTSYVGGIIGYSSATVKDATNNGGNVSGTSYVGGIVGYNNNTNILTENASSNSNSGKISGKSYVGGIVGYAYGSSSLIQNATNDGEVTGTGESIGGIVGYASSATIKDVTNDGNVSGTNYVGGIVGYVNKTEYSVSLPVSSLNTEKYGILIEDVTNNGIVTGTGDNIGGIVGYYSGTMLNAINKGSVNGKSYVGGIVGSANGGEIVNATNRVESSVTATGNGIGGIVGYVSSGNTVTIVNAGNCATVGRTGSNNVGGIIGTVGGTAEVINCYNSGVITSSGNIGGIAGSNSGTLKVESVYYKDNISKAVGSGSCNGTALSMSDANMIAAVGNTNSLSYKLNDYIKKHPSLTILPAMPPVSVGDCVMRKLWEVSNTNNGGYPTISNDDSSDVKCYWTDENVRDTSWYYGHESDNVYTLSTPEQLGGLAYLVNNGINFSGKTIKLGKDIDLSGTTHTNGGDGLVWEPIGKSTDYGSSRYYVRSKIDYAFAGKFDGQGHMIRNMTVKTNISSAGLFGYVNGGTIKNVILDSTCSVTSNYVYYVGGIVGFADNATIIDVTNNATVQGIYCFVGGIVGYAKGGSIENAINRGNVSGKSFVGGIVGFASSTTIKDITNSSIISGTSYVGGIIGYSSATVKDATNGGNVSGTYYVGGIVGYDSYASIFTENATYNSNSGKISGTSYVGGIAGYAYGSSSLIQNATNSGEVTGTGENIGGIVGYASSATIKDVTNSGKVNGVSHVGGIVGYASNATIKDATNSGEVTGTSENIGGIVGYAYNGSITNATNNGEVTGTSQYVGGIVGYTNNTKILTENAISNSNSGKISGTSRVGGIVGYANGGSITNATNSGEVSGSGDHVGGIVGLYDFLYIEYVTNSATINGGSYVGGIAGYAQQKSIKNATNDGSVNGTSYVGGILGYNYGGVLIEDATNNSNVNGVSHVGGIVGYASSATIKDVTNTNNGEVTGTGSNIGGIVGYANNGLSIENATNDGQVIGTGNGSSNSDCIGGIVGNIINGGSIKDVVNTGIISGSGAHIGGIVGASGSVSIENATNSGSVTGESDNVGGIIGFIVNQTDNDVDVVLINCNNTAGISGTNSIGGIVGIVGVYNTQNVAVAIYNSYNLGSITASVTDAGGIFGKVSNNTTARIVNCYNAGGITSVGTKGGIVGGNSGTLTVNEVYSLGTAVNPVGSGSCDGTVTQMNEANMKGALNDNNSLVYKLNEYVSNNTKVTIGTTEYALKRWSVNGDYPTFVTP